MKRRFGVWSTLSIVGFLLLQGFTAADGGDPYLLVKTDKRGFAKSDRDPSLTHGMHVLADLQLLSSKKLERVRVTLPDGKELTLRRQRLEQTGNGYTWMGSIEGEKAGLASFSFTREALKGRIELSNRHFRVVYMGNGVHHIGELDLKKLDEVKDDGEVPKYGKPRDRKDEDGCPDPASDIDLMVVYTQDAEDGAGGPAGMEALLYESVHLTNLAYENSDITQRLHLVHFSKVAYTEAADSATDRERLKNPSDGLMDGIHALRDAHGADIVLLVTETAEPGNCGRAYIMDPVSSAHEEFAFGVVKRECAADNLSFPHELAHIMSARHQDDSATTPFAWGHGHFNFTPADGSGLAWETMMSKTSADRKIYFSNPNVQYSPTGSPMTDPMGDPAVRDNHRVLNDTAATVANFRCSSPNVNNVWMKDRWEDTGLEPDPATAGMAMYVSPYIWIRNAQDPTFLAQHEHENPLFGQTNWIYTKLHNGSFAAQSGSLEFYVADASISLSWPAGWTLVASVPATIPGSSTEILEQAWNSVPDPSSGSSHYCMIARWVSASDPMTTPETTDIGANVRGNNNIVWRNLNVVDADGDSTVVVNAAGLRKSKLARIVFEDQTLFPRPKFVATGSVYISIDDKLLGYWKQGGGITSGLKQLNTNEFMLEGSKGYLDNIPLPPEYRGLIKVSFKRSPETPPNKYYFAVQHFAMDTGAPVLMGGVDYEVVKK